MRRVRERVWEGKESERARGHESGRRGEVEGGINSERGRNKEEEREKEGGKTKHIRQSFSRGFELKFCISP